MNNFKALRKWLNLTQRELAEKLKVSVSTVNGWEAGTRTPSLRKLQALAKLANIRVDDVLTFEIEVVRKEPADNESS